MEIYVEEFSDLANYVAFQRSHSCQDLTRFGVPFVSLGVVYVKTKLSAVYQAFNRHFS